MCISMCLKNVLTCSCVCMCLCTYLCVSCAHTAHCLLWGHLWTVP